MKWVLIPAFLVTMISSVSAQTMVWTVSKQTSKIDDSVNVFASVQAEDPVNDKFGRPHTLSAQVACRENSTHFYFVFDDMFMADSGGYGIVTVRADKDKARKLNMTESTDHGALGLWSGNGVSFLKYLVGKKTLLMVATPYSESSIEATFNMQGYEAAIKEVRAACKW